MHPKQMMLSEIDGQIALEGYATYGAPQRNVYHQACRV